MHSIKDFFKTIYVWLSYVVRNFPIIFIWLLGLFIFLSLNNHGYIVFGDYEQVTKIAFSIMAWCLANLFITINNKSKWVDGWWNLLWHIASILIWVGIYLVWQYFGNEQMVKYSVLLSFFLLIIKIFLWYRKIWKENENDIWYYYSTLIWHIIVGLVYGTTIMLGLFAIVKSVLYLFDISSNHLWMADIAYFAYVIVAPFVFLSYTKFETESYNIHKFIQFFAKYVLVSLLIAYALVILTYVGKIVVTQERPKGILIYMIYWFAAIGLATLYILYPLRNNNPNYTKWQRIYGWLLILFLIVGVFAISIRVKEYGITAPRYIVILLLIWFFYIWFCSLFPKYFHIQRNIFVLWILGFLWVFARPINMYNTVLSSQLSKRESVLTANNLLDENKVVLSWNHENKVSTWDVATLSSVVDYVVNTYEPNKFSKYITSYQEVEYNTKDYYNNHSNKISIMNQVWLQYDDNYYYIMRDGDGLSLYDNSNYVDYYAWNNRNIDIWGQKIYKINISDYASNGRSHDKGTDKVKINVQPDVVCNITWESIITAIINQPRPIVPNSPMWWEEIISYAGGIGSPIKIEGENCTLWIINASIDKTNIEDIVITYVDGIIIMK